MIFASDLIKIIASLNLGHIWYKQCLAFFLIAKRLVACDALDLTIHDQLRAGCPTVSEAWKLRALTRLQRRFHCRSSPWRRATCLPVITIGIWSSPERSLAHGHVACASKRRGVMTHFIPRMHGMSNMKAGYEALMASNVRLRPWNNVCAGLTLTAFLTTTGPWRRTGCTCSSRRQNNCTKSSVPRLPSLLCHNSSHSHRLHMLESMRLYVIDKAGSDLRRRWLLKIKIRKGQPQNL